MWKKRPAAEEIDTRSRQRSRGSMLAADPTPTLVAVKELTSSAPPPTILVTTSLREEGSGSQPYKDNPS